MGVVPLEDIIGEGGKRDASRGWNYSRRGGPPVAPAAMQPFVLNLSPISIPTPKIKRCSRPWRSLHRVSILKQTTSISLTIAAGGRRLQGSTKSPSRAIEVRSSIGRSHRRREHEHTRIHCFHIVIFTTHQASGPVGDAKHIMLF